MSRLGDTFNTYFEMLLIAYPKLYSDAVVSKLLGELRESGTPLDKRRRRSRMGESRGGRDGGVLHARLLWRGGAQGTWCGLGCAHIYSRGVFGPRYNGHTRCSRTGVRERTALAHSVQADCLAFSHLMCRPLGRAVRCAFVMIQNLCPTAASGLKTPCFELIHNLLNLSLKNHFHPIGRRGGQFVEETRTI